MVSCPKCGHGYVFWETSPYKSEIQILPDGILQQLTVKNENETKQE